MLDLLLWGYPWFKALHIVSVIAWMAGLFYLPRLFVYHTEKVTRELPVANDLFITMEGKLFRLIMVPSMISSWVFGVLLVLTPGIVDWSVYWPWCKALSVVAMTWFHFWLGGRLVEFRTGGNVRSGRTYRLMNEVPTLLLLVIVFSVVIKF